MKKSYTDARFEVVDDPRPPRRELPGWFKIMLFGLVALMLLARPIWRFNVEHSDSPVETPVTVEPPAPPVR